MSEPGHEEARSTRTEFERQSERPERSFLGEYWDFLRHERKWWLAPLLLFLLLAGGVIVLGGSGFAPFIYALF